MRGEGKGEWKQLILLSTTPISPSTSPSPHLPLYLPLSPFSPLLPPPPSPHPVRRTDHTASELYAYHIATFYLDK